MQTNRQRLFPVRTAFGGQASLSLVERQNIIQVLLARSRHPPGPATLCVSLATPDGRRPSRSPDRPRPRTITAEEIAKLKAAEAERAERKTLAQAEAKAPTPAKPSPSPIRRRIVACVAGCGEFHPAPSHKPAVVACGRRHKTGRKRKAWNIYNAPVTHEGTEYLIRKLRLEAEEAHASPRPEPT